MKNRINNHILVLITLVGLSVSACVRQSAPDELPDNKRQLDQSNDQRLDLGADPKFILNGVEFTGVKNEQTKTVGFLGIPFAEAPVGPLRWRVPQPATYNANRFNATKFAPACMQGAHLANWYKDVIDSFGGDPTKFIAPTVSEDCLYLNVWAPESALEGKKDLPVYVFVHGGSNKGGWAYEPNYLGERLASQGAVVVTVAYRLGVFGFFSHPDLSISNFALLDQIQALKWVNKNIHLMGGDHNKVTLSGESAGASNISYLMASPLAKGLFQRVVFQSAGWAQSQPLSAKQTAQELGQRLANQVVDENLISEETNTQFKNQLEALRSRSANEILSVSEVVYQNHFFDPVVDGHSVIEPLSESLRKSELAPVDIIVGSNADEALMYLADDETLARWLANNLSEDQANQVTTLLEGTDPTRQVLDDVATAHNYACPALMLAESVVASGGRAWAYYFARVREGKLASQMGAYHGAELPYIFDTHDDWLPTNESDRRVTASIQQHWLRFLQQGNPNGEGLSPWAPFNKLSDPVLVFDETVYSRVHPSAELCKIFWPAAESSR